MSRTEQTIRAPFRRQDDAAEKRLPVLVVLRGAQVGRRYLLNEDALVIGRRADRADLVVPGDPEISSAHCRVEYSKPFGSWVLSDLSSTNGTRVEGDEIQTHGLVDGDRIYLGKSVLKFCFHDELEEEYHRQVDQIMNQDELTGLPVMRIFRERLRDAVVDCTAQRVPLAVLMMDMDGLKSINDSHGHHLGAHTIAVVGRMLGEVIAADGVVSRFGGDEFCVLLPGRTREEGVERAEHVRERLHSTVIELDGLAVRPTISIGVASLPDDASSPEQLMRRADEALYRAKTGGRDRVSV